VIVLLAMTSAGKAALSARARPVAANIKIAAMLNTDVALKYDFIDEKSPAGSSHKNPLFADSITDPYLRNGSSRLQAAIL
jgi:hypothetical protein